jgi:hypothetical protein
VVLTVESGLKKVKLIITFSKIKRVDFFFGVVWKNEGAGFIKPKNSL